MYLDIMYHLFMNFYFQRQIFALSCEGMEYSELRIYDEEDDVCLHLKTDYDHEGAAIPDSLVDVIVQHPGQKSKRLYMRGWAMPKHQQVM